MTSISGALAAALPGVELIQDADMSAYTSFRAGGKASALMDAGCTEDIVRAVKAASTLSIPFYIIGNGTNLLVSDRGLDALIIRIGENLGGVERTGAYTYMAQAGASLTALAKMSVEDGCAGLEWAAGIPGTVGGAVAMNAGAYGGEIKMVLRELDAIVNGKITTLAVNEGDMGYRSSAFRAPESIVLRARFELMPDDGGALARMREYNARRREKQPLSYPSAGSTFKRPEGYFAGKLIEDAGLKGECEGAAQVSELHAGFIINRGGASATDIFRLIKRVQKRVYEASGIMLETEVMLLGEFE